MPIAALITPPGEGGIGVVRLSGKGARAIVKRVFRGSGRTLEELDVGDLAHGHILRAGKVVDEVILALRGPSESAGNGPCYEINCHGGMAAVRAVQKTLENAGARIVDWQTLIGKAGASPLSAEEIERSARRQLPWASTRQAVRMLLHQMDGALERELRRIEEALRDGHEALPLIDRLLSTASTGIALLTPPSLLLAGAPNTGKSTLLNTLLQEERAIVHRSPGTTRDLVRDTLAIDGMPFEIIDSAGIRADTTEIETRAVNRALEQVGQCDILIFLYDVRTGPEAALERLPELPTATRLILAGNKVDLIGSAPSDPQLPREFQHGPHLFISAREGTGIDRLERVLLAPYREHLDTIENSGAVPFTEETVSALHSVRETLTEKGSRSALTELRNLRGL